MCTGLMYLFVITVNRHRVVVDFTPAGWRDCFGEVSSANLASFGVIHYVTDDAIAVDTVHRY